MQPETKSKKPVYFKGTGIDNLSLKDIGSRKVSGYAAIFGNKDSDGDIIIKGCFSKSITDRGPLSATHRKIAFVWMHDIENPIGRITKLIEDDKGLYFEADIDEIPEGDRAITQMKSGTINQFSFGFNYIWDKCQYDSATDAFICKELNLFEISPVTLGANEQTHFTGMKGEQITAKKEEMQQLLEKELEKVDSPLQFKLRKLIATNIALAEVKPQPALDNEEPQSKGLSFDVFKSLLN